MKGFTSATEKDNRIAKGAMGEQVAAAYLEQQGYQIIVKNWRCRSGEIDLVLQLDELLVFVEVRSRSGRTYGTASESVNARKIAQVRKTAAVYLHMFGHTDTPIRFDVIGVQLRSDGSAVVAEHIESAF